MAFTPKLSCNKKVNLLYNINNKYGKTTKLKIKQYKIK